MPESFINLTEGAGKKAHTFQRTIGANTVEDEIVEIGLPYTATYTGSSASAGVSTATAASHLMQLMAGATLNVYVLLIEIYQLAVATAAAIDTLELFRLTTAGTGGTAFTPLAHDTGDAASGATGINLPGVKGTEAAAPVSRRTAQFTQTIATQAPGNLGTLIAQWDFVRTLGKPLRIGAGVTNGIAVKNPTARAGATVIPVVTFVELNY